jgi:hypothetical protein
MAEGRLRQPRLLAPLIDQPAAVPLANVTPIPAFVNRVPAIREGMTDETGTVDQAVFPRLPDLPTAVRLEGLEAAGEHETAVAAIVVEPERPHNG